MSADSERQKGLINRICKALGLAPRDLAKVLGVPETEIKAMLDLTARQLVSADMDYELATLANRVDSAIGVLLAIREELQRKLYYDRQRRLARHERVRNR
ncbi:hypothetical protein [Tepidimonas sp.]|uniref:hypothetical protein n=1 Tax=Tepidimonas sp. TaxID=2002775 RepID=UPI00391A4BFD